MAGDGGKGRGSLRAEDDQIGLLSAALVEEFFGRIAGNDDGLNGDLLLQLFRNQSEHFGFDLVERAAGQNFGAVLGADDVLQDESRAMLGGQFGGKGGDDNASLSHANGGENGADGEVAIAAVNRLGADDIDRRGCGAQNGFSDRADQQLADGAGRVGAHDDAIDLTLAREGENFIGGQTGADHDFALDAGFAGALRQWLHVLLFGSRGGGVVVVTDAGGFRGGDHERVVGMKNDEMRSEFLGLGEREGEGFFVDGNFGGEKDRGGFAPTGL